MCRQVMGGSLPSARVDAQQQLAVQALIRQVIWSEKAGGRCHLISKGESDTWMGLQQVISLGLSE